MSLQAQASARPERRLTLLFIAVGGIFAFLASILGALELARMSGISIPFNLGLFSAHPYLQIFGFLSEFVCGVAYSIIPLFKSRKLPNPRIAYIPFSLITTANALGIIAVVAGGSYFVLLYQVFSLLILVSSILFCYQVIDVLGQPSRLLGEAEPFLSMAAVSFVLVSIVFLADTVFPAMIGKAGLFSPGFIYLSLVGFVGSMIFGVELRTVAFRMTNYRKDFAKIAAAVQGVSIALSFLSIFNGFNFLLIPASLVFLMGAVCFAISIRIFERKEKSRILLPVTSGRPNVASHNTISNYTDACISSSIIWLVFSFSLGVMWLVFGIASFEIRDSFIHSLAIGFVGSAITAYGPVLLPGVLSQKAPKQHLSLIPLLCLDAAVIIRDAGNLYSSVLSTSLPIWESLSGLLVIVAMVLLINNMHFGRKVS